MRLPFLEKRLLSHRARNRLYRNAGSLSSDYDALQRLAYEGQIVGVDGTRLDVAGALEALPGL